MIQARSWTEAGYHKAVLETLWGPEDAAKALADSKELGLSDRPKMRVASALRMVNGQPFRYVVATGVHNGRGSRLLLWGWRGNVEASKQAVGLAIRSLHLSGAPTQSSSKTENEFQDLRMGFALRAPGPTFRVLKDQTPPALRPIGRIVSWSGRDGNLMGMAICNLGKMENTQAMVDRILGNATSAFKGKPKITRSQIGGLPAMRRSWSGKADVWTVVRGRTVYLILFERRPGSLIRPESALSAFRLLD